MARARLISTLAVLAILGGAPPLMAQQTDATAPTAPAAQQGAEPAAGTAEAPPHRRWQRGERMERRHGGDGWMGRGHDRHGDRWAPRRDRRAHQGMAATMRFVTDQLWSEADADGDGKLTEAEVTAFLEARFTAADSNGSGTLDASELAAVVQERLAALRQVAEGRKDANRITRQLDRMTPERMQKMLGFFLNRADDDGDGALSATELRIPRLGADLLRRFDRDGDGAISRDELRHARGPKGQQAAPTPEAPPQP